MQVVQIVFSPTGGTQRVADIIAEALGKPAERVDLTSPTAGFSSVHLDEEDLVVIAVPSYGGRVPALAAERLAQVRGHGARAVLVCVYGNRAYEDTLVELEDVASAAGFHEVAAVAAVAEHSILHQYATGRPDSADRAELEGFARRIAEKLAGQNADAAPTGVPGNRPYRQAGGSAMVPKGDSSCVACGLCARRCPAQAIDPASPRKTDPERCIGCMRCVSECPQGARKVSGALLKAAGLALRKACSERKGCELYL